MSDLDLIDFLQSCDVVKGFGDLIESGHLKPRSEDCNLCKASKKWQSSRVWKSIFEADIFLHRDQPKKAWRKASKAIIGCRKTEPILLSELYIIRSIAALKLNSESTSIKQINQAVALVLPICHDDDDGNANTVWIKSVAIRMKILLQRTNLLSPSLFIEHSAFDSRKLTEEEIAEVIEMLDVLPFPAKLPNCVKKIEKTSEPRQGLFRIEWNEDKGRHWIACDDIEPGELICDDREPVYMYDNSGGDQCYACCRPTCKWTVSADLALSCDDCTTVSFCSLTCYESGIRQHRVECETSHFLHVMRCQRREDDIIGLVLKVFSDEDYRFYQANIDRLLASNHHQLLPDFTHKLSGVFTLQSPGKGFDGQKKIRAGVWASLLNLFLQRTGFLPPQSDTQTTRLLYKLILIVSNNAHGIGNGETPLAFGIYRQATLLNHSCDPNIDKIFARSNMKIFALRTIKKGEEICDSYGKLRVESEPRAAVRRRVLQAHFGFECQCRGCGSSSVATAQR